ncbi:MAG: hypothetical protein GXO43_05130 [Crenarchaeota archaeon]|nr:hypothetical protein [Thermoproteota archaeon]
MVQIKLHVKPDNLFLTQIIYEGIMLVLQHNTDTAKITLEKIELIGDALRKTLQEISGDEELAKHYRAVNIRLAGNDIKYNLGGKLLKAVGIDTKNRITNIGQIIESLLKNFDKIKDISDIEYTYIIGKDFVIGNKSKDLLSGIQLFKTDRYTGLTSLDTDTTYQQFTVKSDPLLYLFAILGLASSYAGGTFEHSYHVFLSPDEIIEILARGDPEYLYNVMSLKREVIRRLREILRSRVPEELLLLKTLIDLGLQELMIKYEIDHLSLQIYVVAREGNTFKIYNKIPLTIYARPYYMEVLRQLSREPEKLIEALQETISPNSSLVKTLQMLEANRKPPDTAHAITAIRMLHRLIISGEPDSLYSFLREIETAAKILEQEGAPASLNRAKGYKYILSRISSTL